MSSVTLAESAKLSQNTLVIGLVEEIITVDQFFDILPFHPVSGNALAYDREKVLGTVQGAGETAGDSTTITATAPAEFEQIAVSLTTILGDAEVNGLIQATRSNLGNDQTSIQIASKAKAAGMQYRDWLVNGDGTSHSFSGLLDLCAASQLIDSTTDNGQELSFGLMDEVIDLVVDKNRNVDYMLMSSRTRRLYRQLLRLQPGAGLNETMELPTGNKVPVYGTVPIFVNDYISNDETVGTEDEASFLIAGTLDDGSQKHGIAGLTAENASGIMVEDVGLMENKDNRKWRVKWYCSLALFSEKGLAVANGIKPTVTV
jgi:hypothetical protein